jgi:Fe-S cluster biogenesis protein NfuA
MLGACSDCRMQDDTIKDGVEAILSEEVEGVKQVVVIE